MDDFRPRRSVLFLPAANPRAIAKARTLDCDAVILDLEDAVAPAMKPAAREAAIIAVGEGGWRHRELFVRVNSLATPWSEGDFAALAGRTGLDGIVVPKVADAADAAVAVSRAGGLPVWAMIESPGGVLAADAIAATPGVAALIAGTADLAKDLHARPGGDRLPLAYGLARIVLSARAAGILAFDGVFPDIGDADGLAREAIQGAAFGFDGKTLIHPSQIDAANAAFAPDAAAVAAAHGLIAAHAAAAADGRGVTVYDGRMIEGLHVEVARRLVGIAEAVAARD